MGLKVLVSTSSFGQVDPRPVQLLEEHGVEYVVSPTGLRQDPAEAVELLQDVDGLIAGTERLGRQLLSSAPKLKVISRCGIGVDNVDLEAASDLGIEVYNTPEAPVDAVAELALAGILDLLRSVSRADREIREGTWSRPMGRLLQGKSVGTIGLGRIGKALCLLLQPFRVTILAHDPVQDQKFARTHNVRYVTLEELLKESDVVTLHLPYSQEVHHLVDRGRLAQMKSGSILVNCSRGGLVDEEALYELLKEGKLGGAHLDTFDEEPYTGPLIGLPNVLLTCHIGSYAAECRAMMELEAVENLLRFFGEL